MTGPQIRGAAAFQVQSSKDGHNWIPRQPSRDGVGAMDHGGDHWYIDHHEAWTAATALRNALTWSEVRIVGKNEAGDIVGAQDIV